MAKLSNLFALVLLVTAIWMPSHHQVEGKECTDRWYDERCSLNESYCRVDCLEVHGGLAKGYCQGDYCFCDYYIKGRI